MPLKGSDAGQFHPFIDDKKEKLYAFVSDLEYNVEFDFVETKSHEGLTVNKYMTDPSVLANYSTIPDKIIFNAKYSGVGNLTSVYKAPIFASQGHYQDIQSAGFMVSGITDSKTG